MSLFNTGFKWSRKHEHCRCCKRNDRRHDSKGLCTACSDRYKRASRGTTMTADQWLKGATRQRASINEAVPVEFTKPGKPKTFKMACEKFLPVGTEVVVPEYKIQGKVACKPYDWPRLQDVIICRAVDIWTEVGRVEGIPLELVRVPA